jgi:hypothetical protein
MLPQTSDAVRAHFRHAVLRLERRMREHLATVGGLERLRLRALEDRVHVAALLRHVAVAALRGFELLPDAVMSTLLPGALVPRDPHIAQRRARDPEVVGDDGHTLADVHDLLHAGTLLGDARVERDDLAADHRALRERGVDHAGLREVDAEDGLAARLVGAVEARQLLADHLELVGGLQLDGCGHRLLRRVRRHLRVAGAIGAGDEHAVLDAHVAGRHVPLRRGGGDEHHAAGGTRLAQRLPRIADAGAAAGDLAAEKLVDVDGVDACLHDLHRARIDLELFGEQHRERRGDVLPHLVAVASEHNHAVGLDRDPRVGLEAAGCRGLRGGVAETKADEESTARGGGNLEEFTTGERVHAAPPSFFAASLIAVRTRPYVPQRQMFPFMALSICASVGFGVLVSSAVAAITCPLWQ